MEFKRNINKVIALFAVLYIVFLTFGLSIVNIALIALFLIYILDFKTTRIVYKEKFKQNKFIYLSFLISAIYQIVIAFLADDLSDRRVGYLGLQLAAIIILLRIDNLKFLLNVFLASLVSLVLLGSYNLFEYYITTGEFNMKGGGHINKLLVVARPYLGFLLSLGTFISIYLFNQVKSNFRIIYCLLPVLFLVYLGIIANRIQIISLLLISLIYLVFYAKVSIFKKVLFFSSLAIIVITTFQLNSNLKDRFGFSNSNEEISLIERLSHIEPRVTIWKCTIGIIQEDNFSHLKGIGNMEVLLGKLGVCYDVSTIDNPMRGYFLSDLFNTHNQFLEYYVLSGIIGFILLCIAFILVFWKAKKSFVPLALFISLMNFCIVENLFDRQIGSYFFGFTIFLIIAISKDIEVKQEKSCRT